MTFAPAMRPRFQVAINVDSDEARRRLTEPLVGPNCPVEGVLAGFHMELKIPIEKRYFWSPNLSVEILEAEGETRLSGLFGPRPSVWTLFATFYGALAFMAFIGGVFGYSQWVLGKTPWAFWGIPVAAVGSLLGYSFALYGQRLARDQMDLLRSYLNRCFDGVSVQPVANERGAEGKP